MIKRLLKCGVAAACLWSTTAVFANTKDDVLLWQAGTWKVFTQLTTGTVSQSFTANYTTTWGSHDPSDAYANHALAADFDGDGFADLCFTRDLGGGLIHWLVNTNNHAPAWPGTVAGTTPTYYGLIANDRPLVGDFDHDGLADLAVFRDPDPATAGSVCTWFINIAGSQAPVFGLDGDIPCVGDFNGDGWADLALFRPSSGGWYVMFNAKTSPVTFSGALDINGLIFGGSSDSAVAAGDLDGDGYADMLLLRPGSNQVLVNLHSTTKPNNAGYGNSFGFGAVDFSIDITGQGFTSGAEIAAANVDNAGLLPVELSSFSLE